FRRIDDLRALEAGGRDADDFELPAVDQNVAVNDRRIAAEPRLPEGMADDDHWMRQPRLVLFGQKGSTERGLDAEPVKIIARNQIAPDLLVIAAPAHAHIRETVGEQSRQDFVAVAEIEIVRIRERGEFPVLTDGRDRDDLLMVGHRQWAEQNQIDQTED